MRPVDGDSLKEEISNLTITITGIRAGKGVLGEFMREYRKTILRTIDEQPTIEPYGTWIPCRERLPGITGIYQVCIYDKECKRKRVWYGQFVYPRYWFVYDMSGDSIPCEITHWMPLPEPFREEKKDE